MRYKKQVYTLTLLQILLFPIILFAIPITLIPLADATVTTVTSDNSGRFLGQAGSEGAACSSMAASGGGWHPNNGGKSQSGRSDGNRCYVGYWRIDLSGLPAGDAISAMTFTFPSISASGGYSADIELRFMTSFSAGSNACSNSNNDSDSDLYSDVIDSSNSTAVSTGDPTSIWSSSTITISAAGVNIAQDQRSAATAAEDVGSLCIVAYESGGPKGGPSSGTEPVYNWASNPGISADITHSPSLNTITVQLYDSSNSTLLNFREPSVKMQGINGSSSAWTECASGTCTFTGITPDTPIRIFANFSDNIVKIDGENSYNRTCGGDCDLKLPVSVYATTNLYFYNSTGGLSADDIVSYDIQYANSTTQTITINAASSTLRWLPNGTNSVLATNLVSNHGLTLNSTTTFNTTASGQGFSFLLNYKVITFTLTLLANDLSTAVNFPSQEPTARAVNLNGTVSGYQTCANTCGFQVQSGDETGFQVRWANQGVLVNASNMINASSADSKGLTLQLSIYKSPRLITYTHNYSLFSPDNMVLSLANGTQATVADFSGGIRTIGWIANGSSQVLQSNALGANRNANGTIAFSVTQDDQAFSFRQRIYSMAFHYTSNDGSLNILPRHNFTLSNGTSVSMTDKFSSFYLGNTSLITTGIKYQNSNMADNGTAIIIADAGVYLFKLQYYNVNYLARNNVNTTLAVDSILYKFILVNGSAAELTTDLSGNAQYFSGNGSISTTAWWKDLIVNGTLSDRAISNDKTYYVITNVVEDSAGVARWAINNSRIQDVVSLGIKFNWFSSNADPQLMKMHIISDKYNQPFNLILNSTTYNDPELSWTWSPGTKILSVNIPFSSGFNSSIVVPYDPSLVNSSLLKGLRPGMINLLSGNIITATSGVYTNILGLYFYVILLATAGAVAYLKSGSVMSGVISIMLVTAGFVTVSSQLLLPPIAVYMSAIIIILGLSIIFYRLFKRDN